MPRGYIKIVDRKKDMIIVSDLRSLVKIFFPQTRIEAVRSTKQTRRPLECRRLYGRGRLQLPAEGGDGVRFRGSGKNSTLTKEALAEYCKRSSSPANKPSEY